MNVHAHALYKSQMHDDVSIVIFALPDPGLRLPPQTASQDIVQAAERARLIIFDS